MQVHRIYVRSPSREIHRTPGLNVDVFSPSRGSNSGFTKWLGKIEPLNTSVDKYAAQESNLGCFCIKNKGVKSLPDEIVADLDPSIRVNLANSVIRESPKFINIRFLSFDAIGKATIAFAPSTIAKCFNGTGRGESKLDWLASRHYFDRVSETTAYSNHIKNSELETRHVFERETENIPLTRQTDLVTPLRENPLTRSTDSSKMKKGTNRR